MALLEVRDLKMYYRTLRGHVRAVDSVSFDIERGKALGIAGESGCGKSSMATESSGCCRLTVSITAER